MRTVIKYGGHATADPAALLDVGGEVVVVHGGGPQITARLTQLNMKIMFINGRRVTTAETMRVVHDVLTEVNAGLAALLGGTRVPGETVLTCTPRDPALGFVGEVTAVDPAPLRAALAAGLIPVVTSVATDPGGALYNVNADTAAAAVAVALGADRLLMLTDVPGLYTDWPRPDSLVPYVTADEVESLLPRLAGGMVPKMEACLRAVRGGVPAAHVLDRLGAQGTVVAAC